MREFNAVLIAIAGWLVLAAANAQDITNVFPQPPMTRLEAMETNTGTIVVKGTALMGSVSAKAGVVSVGCKEDTDTSTGRKEYGIAVELGAAGRGRQRDRTIIDYDELDSILTAIDYFNKIDWSVTSLTSFDAVYTTKAGMQITAFSRNRAGIISFAVRSGQTAGGQVLLSRDELAQFRGLIDQAKRKLDSIRGAEK